MRNQLLPALLGATMLLSIGCGTSDPGEPAPEDISAPGPFETIGDPPDAAPETVEDAAAEVTSDAEPSETIEGDVGPEVDPSPDTVVPPDSDDPADVDAPPDTSTTPDTAEPPADGETADIGTTPPSGCDVQITLAANGDVLYVASSPFSGFQIDHDGSVDGFEQVDSQTVGDAGAAGWTIIWGPKAVLGIDASGATLITSTHGTLVTLTFSGTVDPDAITGFAISGPPGVLLTGCYAGGE